MKRLLFLPILCLALSNCAEKAAPEPSLDDRLQGDWKSTFTRNYYDGAGNKVFEEQVNDTVLYRFTKGYVTLSKQNTDSWSSRYVLHQLEEKKYIRLDTPGGSEYQITFLTEERMYWQVPIMGDTYTENGITKQAAKMVLVKAFVKK